MSSTTHEDAKAGQPKADEGRKREADNQTATRGDQWSEDHEGKIYEFKITDEGVLMRRRRKAGADWHIVTQEHQLPERKFTADKVVTVKAECPECGELHNVDVVESDLEEGSE